MKRKSQELLNEAKSYLEFADALEKWADYKLSNAYQAGSPEAELLSSAVTEIERKALANKRKLVVETGSSTLDLSQSWEKLSTNYPHIYTADYLVKTFRAGGDSLAKEASILREREGFVLWKLIHILTFPDRARELAIEYGYSTKVQKTAFFTTFISLVLIPILVGLFVGWIIYKLGW